MSVKVTHLTKSLSNLLKLADTLQKNIFKAVLRREPRNNNKKRSRGLTSYTSEAENGITFIL